ncbi:hypothetical protein J1614_008356 [Plenodomus biglobosus]|nr:hypothetical protein J1614_008356 [Plenodomus biglobosus]
MTHNSRQYLIVFTKLATRCDTAAATDTHPSGQLVCSVVPATGCTELQNVDQVFRGVASACDSPGYNTVMHNTMMTMMGRDEDNNRVPRRGLHQGIPE